MAVRGGKACHRSDTASAEVLHAQEVVYLAWRMQRYRDGLSTVIPLKDVEVTWEQPPGVPSDRSLEPLEKAGAINTTVPQKAHDDIAEARRKKGKRPSKTSIASRSSQRSSQPSTSAGGSQTSVTSEGSQEARAPGALPRGARRDPDRPHIAYTRKKSATEQQEPQEAHQATGSALSQKRVNLAGLRALRTGGGGGGSSGSTAGAQKPPAAKPPPKAAGHPKQPIPSKGIDMNKPPATQPAFSPAGSNSQDPPSPKSQDSSPHNSQAAKPAPKVAGHPKPPIGEKGIRKDDAPLDRPAFTSSSSNSQDSSSSNSQDSSSSSSSTPSGGVSPQNVSQHANADGEAGAEDDAPESQDEGVSAGARSSDEFSEGEDDQASGQSSSEGEYEDEELYSGESGDSGDYNAAEQEEDSDGSLYGDDEQREGGNSAGGEPPQLAPLSPKATAGTGAAPSRTRPVSPAPSSHHGGESEGSDSDGSSGSSDEDSGSDSGDEGEGAPDDRDVDSEGQQFHDC